MIPIPTHEEQMAAFERYAQAVRKVEKSLDFQDAIAAKEAWIGFLNVWLPDEKKMPEKRLAGGNIERFPVHKTRP